MSSVLNIETLMDFFDLLFVSDFTQANIYVKYPQAVPNESQSTTPEGNIEDRVETKGIFNCDFNILISILEIYTLIRNSSLFSNEFYSMGPDLYYSFIVIN